MNALLRLGIVSCLIACTGGDGERTCSASADCLGGELCDDGICREACSDDDPCTAAGTVCSGGVCIVGCARDFDCPGGQRCDEGACVPIGEPECTDDGDCGGGERCSGGECVPIAVGCERDEECEEGERCVPGLGQCQPFNFDAGMIDAGDTPFDGGMTDGGMTSFDGGMTMGMDAGRDAGPLPPTDAGGSVCSAAGGCPATQRCCNDRCANREVPVGDDGRSDSSFQHCGTCNSACDLDRASACSRTGGAPRCMCGEGSPCTGDAVCVPIFGGTFDCTDLDTDEDNCGSVGNACADGEDCVAGNCTCGDSGACGADEACCGGECIDTASDPENCGGCGLACAPYGNRCVSGDCLCGTASCARPSGTNLGQICCSGACRAQDNNNCHGCGTMCAAGSSCVVGTTFPGTMADTCCSSGSFPGFCF
jgi:hypothetical protein